MKYLKTYEALSQEEKEEFKKSKDQPWTTFNINQIKKDCRTYDIIFINLLREIFLSRKISFKCECCYNDQMLGPISGYINDVPVFLGVKFDNHHIIGICTKITHENESFWDSDVIARIEGKENWHTLYTHVEERRGPWEKKIKERRIRVFNYVEGPLMQELELKKSSDKYNL